MRTNRALWEWNEVFLNAACVVTLVDRLTNCSDITEIKEGSYRLKEAQERRAEKARLQAKRPGRKAAVQG